MDEDAVEDLFADILRVRIRRMFGGLGIFDGELMFALVAYGELYLKTTTQTAPEFAEAGGRPFVYEAKGKRTTMSYWTPPEAIFDDGDALRHWTMLALEAARAAKAPVRRRG